MDALFWIYIISVVAVALMGDFKEMAEDKPAPSQEKCDTTLRDLRRERARIESRMVDKKRNEFLLYCARFSVTLRQNLNNL